AARRPMSGRARQRPPPPRPGSAPGPSEGRDRPPRGAPSRRSDRCDRPSPSSSPNSQNENAPSPAVASPAQRNSAALVPGARNLSSCGVLGVFGTSAQSDELLVVNRSVRRIGDPLTAIDMIQFDVIRGIAASLISVSIVVLWFIAVT